MNTHEKNHIPHQTWSLLLPGETSGLYMYKGTLPKPEIINIIEQGKMPEKTEWPTFRRHATPIYQELSERLQIDFMNTLVLFPEQAQQLLALTRRHEVPPGDGLYVLATMREHLRHESLRQQKTEGTIFERIHTLYERIAATAMDTIHRI